MSTIEVKVGHKVSEGRVILTLDSASQGAAATRKSASPPSPQPSPASGRGGPSPAATPKPAPAPTAAAQIAGAATYSGRADIECQMLVIGAGPGGYSAAFRSADLGMKTVLIERYPTLGGVCLNVGCIPSKALLHIAAVMDEAAVLGEHGITYAPPKIDLHKPRGWKNKVVGKLTGGPGGMAKARKGEGGRGGGGFP